MTCRPARRARACRATPVVSLPLVWHSFARRLHLSCDLPPVTGPHVTTDRAVPSDPVPEVDVPVWPVPADLRASAGQYIGPPACAPQQVSRSARRPAPLSRSVDRPADLRASAGQYIDRPGSSARQPARPPTRGDVTIGDSHNALSDIHHAFPFRNKTFLCTSWCRSHYESASVKTGSWMRS